MTGPLIDLTVLVVLAIAAYHLFRRSPESYAPPAEPTSPIKVDETLETRRGIAVAVLDYLKSGGSITLLGDWKYQLDGTDAVVKRHWFRLACVWSTSCDGVYLPSPEGEEISDLLDDRAKEIRASNDIARAEFVLQRVQT